jgi:hypothetical protein
MTIFFLVLGWFGFAAMTGLNFWLGRILDQSHDREARCLRECKRAQRLATSDKRGGFRPMRN